MGDSMQIKKMWQAFKAGGIKEPVQTIQAVVTIIALLMGGIWSYNLFIKHRELYAKADIQHKIATVRLTNDKILLRVAVSIHNSGNVLLPLREGEVRIERVLPLSDVSQEKLGKDGGLIVDANLHLWPTIKLLPLKWQRGQFNIEPGEQDEIPADFVLSSNLEVVNVDTHLTNPSNPSLGWRHSTIVNLMDKESGR